MRTTSTSERRALAAAIVFTGVAGAQISAAADDDALVGNFFPYRAFEKLPATQIDVGGGPSRVEAGADGFDLLLTGTVFQDIIFTGLDSAPVRGTESWARGMGSSPGGIANMAGTH
jgi:hypothetical protein